MPSPEKILVVSKKNHEKNKTVMLWWRSSMNIGAGPVFWYISPTPLIHPLRHTDLLHSTMNRQRQIQRQRQRQFFYGSIFHSGVFLFLGQLCVATIDLKKNSVTAASKETVKFSWNSIACFDWLSCRFLSYRTT